jgi:heme/copper-type cytochrome/quinol oxidase subunit 2
MARLTPGFRLALAAGLVGLGATLVTGRLAGPLLGGSTAYAQDQAPTRRDFHVTARKYAYAPPRLEVSQDDLVKITLHSDDIPHTFTVDAYRIDKRVGAGQTVTVEFRADQVGTFPIYCKLRQDDKCREMRGELVVRPR